MDAGHYSAKLGMVEKQAHGSAEKHFVRQQSETEDYFYADTARLTKDKMDNRMTALRKVRLVDVVVDCSAGDSAGGNGWSYGLKIS